ncbi:MAG: DsbA family protein [Hyphomicrobiaceae bacterium]|nr:DsbA family protein [Hyphomicrobiaceae bacterium]
MSEDTARNFVYFADPMCSWCYGFAPVMARLFAQFQGRLGLKVVMGGLRAGNTTPMTDKDRAYIRAAWEKVGEATGQPFNFAFFDRESFTYDTEPACRAVVAARLIDVETALPLKARISRAFYAENRDMTAAGEIADVAAEAGLPREEFLRVFEAPATQNETFRDFLTAQELGIRGFPTLVAGTNEGGYALVTNGYRRFEDLADPLEHWLAAGAPVRNADA